MACFSGSRGPFEAAKFQVESRVSLFNAKGGGCSTPSRTATRSRRRSTKTRLEGALAKLKVFKAEIAAQRRKGSSTSRPSRSIGHAP